MTDETRAPDSGVRYSPHRRASSQGLRHLARRGRERGVIGGYRAAEAAIGRVSPRFTVPVARSLFLGGYFGWPHKRRIVLANASHILGLPSTDPAVAHLARRIYASYAQYALDVMRLPSRPVDEPLTLVMSTAERGLDSYMDLWRHYSAQGRGIIAVSGHIGSIEVFAAASGLRGVPTYGLADDTAYPELLARLTEVRAKRKIEVILWRNLRDVFRALRRPGVLGLLVDWGYRPDDVPVKLFGSWTTLPSGPASLAARTGAVILPVVNRRLDDGTYLASHHDPIEVSDASPAELLRATQAIADSLEAMVREAPEQWLVFKPMWPSTATEAAALERRAAEMAASGAPEARAGQRDQGGHRRARIATPAPAES